MESEKQFEKSAPITYQDLVRIEIESGRVDSQGEAVNAAELIFFNERIGQFTESDLVEDPGGGWNTFEQKVRAVFPEFPEDRFRAIKAAVTMHLCEL
jgi:hypothetical protein